MWSQQTVGPVDDARMRGRSSEGVDGSVLREAQKLLGTKSARDTVNVALRQVVRHKLIEQFFADMRERDPEELDQARKDAWR
jgi:Arc/MetJ family transcription regulator